MNVAPFTATFSACALLAASAATAQHVVDLEADTLAVGAGATESAVVIRHPYLKAYVIGNNDPATSPATPPPPLALNRLELARPWIRLLSDDRLNEDWEPPACREGEGGLCNLRWRKNNAFSAARSRLEEVSTGLKAKVVGKSLARHLEVDIDSSPEIKFEWEFD